MRNFVRKVLEQGSMLAVYHRYANPVAYSDQLDGLAFNLAKTAPPQPKPLTDQEPVAWMVYTQDGQSVYVTDNPTDIKEGQRALPLYTTQLQLKQTQQTAAVASTFKGERFNISPIARIKSFDEYGPLLEWYTHWINFPVGTKLFNFSPARPELRAIYQTNADGGATWRDQDKPAFDYNTKNGHQTRIVYEAIPAPEQPEQEPVAIPGDVRKVAKAMQKDGYRGPLAWAKTVIDFVADYTAPPQRQPQPEPPTDPRCVGCDIVNGCPEFCKCKPPHPPQRQPLTDGIKQAAAWVRKRQENYLAEHGSICPDTGAVEFGRGPSAETKSEYVGELEEIIEGIEALALCDVPPTGWTCTRPKDHKGPCAAHNIGAKP